jgi:hypothetical protein
MPASLIIIRHHMAGAIITRALVIYTYNKVQSTSIRPSARPHPSPPSTHPCRTLLVCTQPKRRAAKQLLGTAPRILEPHWERQTQRRHLNDIVLIPIGQRRPGIIAIPSNSEGSRGGGLTRRGMRIPRRPPLATHSNEIRESIGRPRRPEMDGMGAERIWFAILREVRGCAVRRGAWLDRRGDAGHHARVVEGLLRWNRTAGAGAGPVTSHRLVHFGDVVDAPDLVLDGELDLVQR